MITKTTVGPPAYNMRQGCVVYLVLYIIAVSIDTGRPRTAGLAGHFRISVPFPWGLFPWIGRPTKNSDMMDVLQRTELRNVVFCIISPLHLYTFIACEYCRGLRHVFRNSPAYNILIYVPCVLRRIEKCFQRPRCIRVPGQQHHARCKICCCCCCCFSVYRNTAYVARVIGLLLYSFLWRPMW